MKNLSSMVYGCLLAFWTSTCCGQTNGFQMPKVGEPLPMAKFELVNRIPASRWKRLPKALVIYRYSNKPSNFSAVSLQGLLDKSAFAGTNAVDLLQGNTNTASLQEAVRLATPRNLDYFIVAPARGGILVQNSSDDRNPPADAVPKFDVVQEELLAYARTFGISTNDMERNEDGTIHARRTEDKISRMGGAVNFIARRSVAFSRSVEGFTILANRDRIELAEGVKGRILKFELNWPRMEAVCTNRVLNLDEVLAQIKDGRALGETSNQYPNEGVAQIILKDVRIQYYAPVPSRFEPLSTKADIFPVASFYAIFKSKSGKSEEGGLFAPILESK